MLLMFDRINRELQMPFLLSHSVPRENAWESSRPKILVHWVCLHSEWLLGFWWKGVSTQMANNGPQICESTRPWGDCKSSKETDYETIGALPSEVTQDTNKAQSQRPGNTSVRPR